MNAILARWATPLTLGLFLVSAISGVALFFHVQQGLFHGMHEWLSLVLLAPFLLHVQRNWAPLLSYLRRRALWAPLGLSLVAALAFAAPAAMQGARGGSPMLAMRLIAEAPLDRAAPVLKTTPEKLRAALAAKGAADAATLQAAATASHIPVMALIAELSAN
jgi:hypothetical protein